MDSIAIDYKISSALRFENENSWHEFISKRYGHRTNDTYLGPNSEDKLYNDGPEFNLSDVQIDRVKQV